MNWHGDQSALAALAHEVGHAVAMHTQTQSLGNLLSSHPSLTAELTALFAERMLYDELARRAKTPKEKLFAKYQMLANYHFFYMERAYQYGAAVDLQERYGKDGQYRFSADVLDAWWADAMKQAYGSSVRDIEKLAPLWVTRHHLFTNDPFYVGDYSMACLITQVVMDKYHSGETYDLPDRFIQMLDKGATDYAPKLIKGLGADIEERGFWKKAVKGIHREMDELEQLIAEEKENHKNSNRTFAARIVASRPNGHSR